MASKKILPDNYPRYLRGQINGNPVLKISNADKGKLEHSVNQFDDLCRRLGGLSHSAILKLSEAAFKPKLKTRSEISFY